ncbi:MAG: hypothetical protein Q7J80_15970 [Anaerolineales bacterium]|nr:hypothetical protein [Anaerolineales bacterium]
MPQSEYRARQVAAKTHEVFEYDRDDEKPGKPLHILIPGGLIALAVLALIIFIAYQTWFEENLTQNLGLTLIIILAPFYVGGVFLFSYGYELYNLPRALRLTAIIVFVTLASVVILAVLILALGNMKGGSDSSPSKTSRKSTSRSTGSSRPSIQNKSGLGGGMIGGAVANKSSSSSSSAGNSQHLGVPIFIGGLGGTRIETREVTRDVIKEVPKEPMPITCPFCTRSYIPVEYNYICPSCGAATPKDLIEESQMPKE